MMAPPQKTDHWASFLLPRLIWYGKRRVSFGSTGVPLIMRGTKEDALSMWNKSVQKSWCNRNPFM